MHTANSGFRWRVKDMCLERGGRGEGCFKRGGLGREELTGRAFG